MSKLCITLPPFAPDYSGAASMLFDLGGMIVIHDAAGCTGNYLGYDEPRYFNSTSLVFCSALRHMDAILGNDDALIEKIVKAAHDLKPKFIAILGSPVPMIIGTDFQGIAHELEMRLSLPCFGLDTKGLSYYTKGASLAIIELVKRFAKSPTEKNGINILGASPLDFFSNENVRSFISLFEKNKIPVHAIFGMENSLEKISDCLNAKLNLVVSVSGIEAAHFMKKKFDIPFICTCPIGDGKRVLEKVQNALFEKAEIAEIKNCDNATEYILIVGDEIINHAICDEILEKAKMSEKKIAVVCGNLFFENESKNENAIFLHNETELRKLLRENKFQKIIADPLIKDLCSGNEKFYELPHPAISSRIHWNETKKFLSLDFEKFLEKIILD